MSFFSDLEDSRAEQLTLRVRYASSSSVMKSGILPSAAGPIINREAFEGFGALVCRWRNVLDPEMLEGRESWLGG